MEGVNFSKVADAYVAPIYPCFIVFSAYYTEYQKRIFDLYEVTKQKQSYRGVL